MSAHLIGCRTRRQILRLVCVVDQLDPVNCTP
jgi:hypothetical protein